MSLTLPVVDESGPVRDGARSLLNVYMGVVDVTDEIASTWAGLSTAYSTPEAPDVLDAMTQPGTCARTLAADADGACAALLAYADRLDELKTLREQLTADIAAHEAKAAATSQDSAQSDDSTAQQHQQNLLHSEAVALEGRVAKVHSGPGGSTTGMQQQNPCRPRQHCTQPEHRKPVGRGRLPGSTFFQPHHSRSIR